MEIASIPMPDAIGRLEKHLLSEFADAVEEWSLCVNRISEWEDKNLVDNPTPEKLAVHKQTIEKLLAFGRFISLATSQSEFPDRKTAAMVDATQSCLQDMLSMRHGPRMSPEKSGRILAQAFTDEP